MNTPAPEEILERFAAARAAIERAESPPDIFTLFDRAAARYADRTLWAPADPPGEILTYRAFAERVHRTAAALARLGVGPGTHVALMLPNVSAFAAIWMALSRLGAVLVAVNTRFTARELAFVLEASEAELLIIDHRFLPVLAEIPAASLRLDPTRIVVHGAAAPGYGAEWNARVAHAAPTRRAHAPLDPDILASLQFTSGSTGFPKGCMLSHRYWVTIARVRAGHGVPVQRILLDMPFHYMGGQWRFLMALLLGATVFAADQPSRARFLDRLLGADIEFCTVNDAFAKLPEDPRYAKLRLKWVLSVGLAPGLQAGLERRLGAPVRELYGTTETGAALAMPIAASHKLGSGATGLPVAFRECLIVDEAHRPVPSGTAGELWIAGPGIFAGYYKRPDADADVRSGKWFRTGDLFRQDPEGYFHLLGRIKDVIRRSGENISAIELEQVLQGMSEIMEVAAVPVPDPVRGEEVKIYVALKPDIAPESVPPSRIQEYCKERLARFKLPRYVEYLDRLPRTASDKVEKPALLKAKPDLRAGSFDCVDNIWR